MDLLDDVSVECSDHLTATLFLALIPYSSFLSVPFFAGYCANTSSCMESCESLLRGSRQLAGSFFDFEDLIPIAIGYDLRHMAADIRAQGHKGPRT